MRRSAQISALEKRMAEAQPNCKSLRLLVPSELIATFSTSAISTCQYQPTVANRSAVVNGRC